MCGGGGGGGWGVGGGGGGGGVAEIGRLLSVRTESSVGLIDIVCRLSFDHTDLSSLDEHLYYFFKMTLIKRRLPDISVNEMIGLKSISDYPLKILDLCRVCRIAETFLS